MSGVIDGSGQQWERCNQCAGWCKFQDLDYAPINQTLPIPSWIGQCGNTLTTKVDMCPKCMAGIPWVGGYRDHCLNRAKRSKAERASALIAN